MAPYAEEQPVTVWGYRNVWFRFHMAEATVMAPVNDQGLGEMDDAFMTCFSTQKVCAYDWIVACTSMRDVVSYWR